MKHTIDYEFNVLLDSVSERLGEEYYNTTSYKYEVPEDKLKQVILNIVCWAYDFNDDAKSQLKKFIDIHDMWYELLEEYEDEIDDALFDLCYNDAETDFFRNERGQIK